MGKELVVSSNSHETKVAVLEDNQVVEVFFEREKEYSLAGSICKGRVMRVLPGMQSAFVDIGLERDAFLYVSDFFEEDAEEYERIVSTVEEKVTKLEETRLAESGSGKEVAPPAETAERSVSAPPKAPVAEERAGVPASPPRHLLRGSRRRRPRQKEFPESKYARRESPPARPPEPEGASPPSVPPIILPGESLAKYKDRGAASFLERQEELEATAAPDVSSPEAATKMEAAAEAPTEPGTEERAPQAAEAGTARGTVSDYGMTGEDAAPEVSEPSAASTALETTPAPQESEGSGAIPEHSSPESEFLFRPPEEPTASPVAFPKPPPEELAAAAETASQVPSFAEELPAPVADEAALSQEEAAETVPVAAAEEAPQSTEESAPQSREAAVRERQRNPRYQRKARWMARREARPDDARSSPSPRPQDLPKPQIADLLKEGKEIIVQIAKEPLGKKGARITSHIALPGRYLVYMPTVAHVGISHKISSEEERQRLKKIILEHTRDLSGGFIVRTAGEGHSEQELRQDILFLTNLWAHMKAAAEKAKAPALLHQDLDVIQRILRDQLSEKFDTVWVDNEAEYERIVGWVSDFQPSLIGRVKLYTKDIPLFEAMGVQEEINKALKPKVWLKSGGYIVINQTEALVAIDVNTGKYVGKSNRLEDTIVKTNVDAIQEIVRQIRLRDLGGIIVIDFIDMDERKNRQKVMAAMEDALRADRSPSKILAFNEFGLVAITRKRVRQSLERTLCQPCPHCDGSGLVKSVASVCCEISTEARKMAADLAGRQVTLRVNPEVGKSLKARDNSILLEIEEMTGKPVVVRNDPALDIEKFAFE